MYNIMISKNNPIPTGQIKWNTKFNRNNSDWRKIFSIPFRIFKETKMIWFRTKINHFILDSNSLIHKNWECSKTQEFFIAFEENQIQFMYQFIITNQYSYQDFMKMELKILPKTQY